MNGSKPVALRAVFRRRVQSGVGPDSQCPVPPHPNSLPDEREKHSPVPWLYDRPWLSCASETKDREAGTATTTFEFPSGVAAFSLSMGRGQGCTAVELRCEAYVSSPCGAKIFIAMESRKPKLHRSDMEMNMAPRWGFSSRWVRGYNDVAPLELKNGSSAVAPTTGLIQR